MVENIKLLLGDAASNFSETQIELAYSMASAEIEAYCNRELDSFLEMIAARLNDPPKMVHRSTQCGNEKY